MDDRQFDELSRSLARQATRRTWAGLVVGLGLAAGAAGEAAADDPVCRRRCKHGTTCVQTDPTVSDPKQAATCCRKKLLFVDPFGSGPFCCSKKKVCADDCCYPNEICTRDEICCKPTDLCERSCCRGSGDPLRNDVACYVGECIGVTDALPSCPADDDCPEDGSCLPEYIFSRPTGNQVCCPAKMQQGFGGGPGSSICQRAAQIGGSRIPRNRF